MNSISSCLRGSGLRRRSRGITALLTASLVAAAPAATAALDARTLDAGAASPLLAAVASPDRIVNPVPAKFTPQFNGNVYAITQVGDTMVVGGSFTSVTPVNAQGTPGTAVARTNIVAFNAATGVINTGFNPSLSGPVQAVQPGPTAGTVFVGGNFTGKLKLLNLSNGNPTAGFTVPTVASGNVNDIDIIGNRLYLGGSFRKVGGKQHIGLATLNATTGAVDPYATLDFTGHHNWSVESGGAKAAEQIQEFAISPDGSTMVSIGNFTDISGVARDQVAMLDLSGPAAAVDLDWNTSRFDDACATGAFDSYVRDVDFSPDGSYFSIVGTGGPFPGSLCDTVTRWETNAIGTNIQPTWIDDAGGDTLYSVAITDDAIYVGGHQRWLNNASGRDFAGGGAVPRPGLGAVDPLSGVPLEWNPGRNPRGIAIYDMFVGQTGLWIGSNTDFIGNRKYKRPKLAFFPTAGGEVAPAGVSPSLPGNLYLGSPLPGTNSNILYRVNTGGPMIGATDNGPDWAGDRGDTNSPYRNGGSNDADWGDLPFNRGANLPATTPTAVFSTERWSPSDNPPMEWDFPAPTGDDVTVRLYFANGCSCTETPGARRFNVALDGTRVLDAYDIVADVGDQTGTMKEFTVTSDGNVDIDFSHQDENPLVNAIEIIDTDIAPPPPGSDPGLRYRSVNGTTIGSEVDAADGGTDWSAVRGATKIDDLLYYAKTDGMLYRRTFTTGGLGPEQAVNPYTADPIWNNVATGSGQTYQGALPNFYNELSSLTGMAYRDGRLYYTVVADSSLHWVGFSPESGIVTPERYDVPGVSLPGTRGLVLSGDDLYTTTDEGNLTKRPWNNGSPGTTSTTVSGPTIDGIDWRARALFVGP